MKSRSSYAAKRISFRRKLLLSIAGIAVPVLAIVWIGSYCLLSVSFRQTLSQMLSADLSKVSGDMSNIIDNTESLSRDMIFNSEIQKLLAQSASGEQYPENSAASYYINGFIANRDFISCVVLTGMDQTLYSTERAFTNLSDFSRIEQSGWFEQLESSDEPYEWFVCTYEDTGSAGYEEKPSLMLARPIYSLDDYTTRMGYMMIYLDDEYLSDVLGGFQFGDTTNMWLTDKGGSVILGNEAERDYSFLLDSVAIPIDEKVVFSQGHRYAVGSEEFSENGWYLCMAIPYSEINASMTVFSLLMLLLVLVIVFLSVFLIVKTSASISGPIIRLSHFMDAYGSTGVEIPVPEEDDYQYEADEIQSIYESYREMILRLHTLVQEVYIKNLEKKDAELALLQTQINPHFLYNTLDSINWMALANDQDEISEMITALSDMFRLSLMKSSSSYITLKQEMEYVQSYLVLLKCRQGDALKVSVNLDENISGLYIPRFILQPLLENAVKYASAPDGEAFLIEISVRRTQDELCISIVNDGTGIDLEQMDKVLDFDPDKMELLNFELAGYGVQNIQRRIRILCGKKYGLTYSAEHGHTVCEVHLPVLPDDP